MVWWTFQVLYALAVMLWLTGAALLLREFFREYRGKIFDDRNLNRRAGIPDHGAIEIIETAEYQAWKEDKFHRTRLAFALFIVGIALHTTLYFTQTWFLPRFEIPFYSSPVEQAAPENPEQAP